MPNTVLNMLQRSSVVTKVWEIGDGTVLSTRHWTGGTQLMGFVNGNQVFDTVKCIKGFKKIMLKRGKHKYRVVVELVSGMEFTYALRKEGLAKGSTHEIIPDDSINSSAWSPDQERHQRLQSLVSIPTTRVCGANDGELKGVAQYMLKLEASATHGASETWHRFSDFDNLYTYVLSFFQGSHIKSSVAKLPPKSWRRHATDPLEIEARRQALEIWLCNVAAMPLMAHNPDVLRFIGVFSATSALEPGVEPEPELAPAKSTPDPEKLAQLHSAQSVGLLSDTELAESLRKISLECGELDDGSEDALAVSAASADDTDDL